MDARASRADDPPAVPAPVKGALADHEAWFYEKIEDGKVRCMVCPRHCETALGERGWCGTRFNDKGVYKSLVYAKIVSAQIDPIEKKPVYHYLPGTTALSVATAGCNFACKFCQNWEISQAKPEEAVATDLPPERLAQIAAVRKCATLAFTYTEPVVFSEYVYDAAVAARKAGIGSVMISNGFINADPLEKLAKQLTAIKVDFKSFSEKFYKDICKGELGPVQDTMILVGKLGIHLEIVVLLVPTLNDDPEQLKALAGWIVDKLGPDVPLHFSRFTPLYKLKNLPATPVKTLESAYEISRKAGVRYVYIGNVPFHDANNTYCHNCKSLVIERLGFAIRTNNLTDKGACHKCGQRIPGIWSQKEALGQKSAQ